MKRIGFLLLAFLMLFQITVFADEVLNSEIQVIAYEEAVNLMVENSNTLKNIEKQIEIQKEAIIEINAESRRLKQDILRDPDEVLERATKVFLDPMDAEKKLKDLERSLEDTKFDLQQSVLDYYVNWATLQNKLDLYKNILSVQEKEYNQKQLEKKLGKITDNDLLTYKIAFESAQRDLDYAQREYDLALLDFNYLVMDSLEIKYTMDISNLESLLIGNYIDLESIDLNLLAEKNIEMDSTLASLSEDLPRIEEKKRVDQLYSDSVTVMEDYNDSIQENKNDTKNRVNELKYNAFSDYYNLKSLGLDIRIAQNNLKLANSALEVIKVKEKLGLVTSLEVVKAEKDALTAENSVTNALNSYYKAYHDFVRYY